MKLLEAVKIGGITLKNSMIMAAMTRSRAGIDGVIGDKVAEYYTQRVNVSLIPIDGINISENAVGSPSILGIYNQIQITHTLHSGGLPHTTRGRIKYMNFCPETLRFALIK